MLGEQEKMRLNGLSQKVVQAFYEVHKELGPGLLESVYQHALLMELKLQGLYAESHLGLELIYKGIPTGKFFEMDIVIEQSVIVELKAVEIMHPVFQAQMISYLKLSGYHLGFLVNFNVPLIKDGIKRFVNNF